MIDTVLLDTSVIGYMIYHSWYGQQSMEDYVEQCVEMYEKIPFYYPACKSLVWLGDSKPYFRKLLLRTYKGSRPEKEKTLQELMSHLDNLVNPLRYPHFEADDIFAAYVKTHPAENIMIFSVDSDLLQLIREPILKTLEGNLFTPLKSNNTEQVVQGEVLWCCAKGYEPQLRRLPDRTFQRWFENKLCASAKKLKHLDVDKPGSIIDWKVIMGDTSDTISSGEQYRWLIDLNNPPKNWVLLDQYPEFKRDADAKRKQVQVHLNKSQLYDDFLANTASKFPTAKSWEKPRVTKKWKTLT